MMVSDQRYAHSIPGVDPGKWHRLEDHLRSVAERTGIFAEAFGAPGWGYTIGLLHDVGKYSDEFQEMLRSPITGDAHLEANARVNHSSAGGVWANREWRGRPNGKLLARIVAYAVLGHHAGLADFRSDRTGGASLRHRLECTDTLPAFMEFLPADLLSCLPATEQIRGDDPALFIRMLFSCLVDADFLDTEDFFDPDRSRLRGESWPALPVLAEALQSHLSTLASSAPPSEVNRVRGEVLQNCLAAACEAPGVFTFTVPTGGGKTYSSLAFGLGHAFAHGKRRVIYAVPFTTVVEQTADAFRRVPGFENAVVEHHSNLDPDDPDRETPQGRLAAENWSAPVIVTTNVQLFESLFASRPSRCRKLHNIAKSVVILDEAQSIPRPFLTPIVRMISNLARAYGVTFVLCTATQPDLHPVETFGYAFEGITSKEIVRDPADLFRRLSRVRLQFQGRWPEPVATEELAREVVQWPRVLCIVDRKDDCRRLHRLLPEGTRHLSTRMCGAHRARAIEEIREALAREDGRPIRVVSTQLVEAGVDIDFPVVYRAVAGLDSIAQAAGRCNREGRLAAGGKYFVYAAESEPPRDLRLPASIGREILLTAGADALSPLRFEEYFRQLLRATGQDGLDKFGILDLLASNRELEFSFATAAERFRMIDDSWQRPVIVPYGHATEMVDRLIEERWDARRWLRRLQRFTVSLPAGDRDRLLVERRASEVPGHPGLVSIDTPGLYRDDVGLVLPWEEPPEEGVLIA